MRPQQERGRWSLQTMFQNVAGSLLVILVVGIYNAATTTTDQLKDLNTSMAGLRRDVDRHESMLMRYGYNTPGEIEAEQRRETGRHY